MNGEGGTRAESVPPHRADEALAVRSDRSAAVWLTLAIALLIGSWPYLPALSWMWDWWLYSPEYSHGLLLPPLVAFLIWRRRARLRASPFAGSWLGLAVVAAAAALYVVGELASLYFLVHVSYWLLLCGVLLSLLGRPAFRLVAAPLAILLLAIPMPAFFIDSLSAKLQFWSSSLGVAFIRLFGISVLLQGNVIDLGPYQLEVAEACSGVRYLFPLLTLGAVLAYLYKGATWKRVAVFLSAIPLTLITNSLRIGSIGVLVDRWGPGVAAGFVHDFQGWAMFMITGAALVGELALLHRIGGGGGSWRDALEDPGARADAPPAPATKVSAVPRSFVAVAVAVVTFGILAERLPMRAEAAPARRQFAEFPDRLGDWIGRHGVLGDEYLRTLYLDDYLLADYARAGAPPVNIYSAFYSSQHKGSSVHSPRSCLPGSGWEIQEFERRTVPGLSVGQQPLVVNRAVIALGNQRALVYYWFQERGRVMTNEYTVKWLLVWDAVTRHRTDGALVRITTPLPSGSRVDDADRRLAAFASTITPIITQYVPD
jgi:exosortase D (VPLPA-CTERM-specific)